MQRRKLLTIKMNDLYSTPQSFWVYEKALFFDAYLRSESLYLAAIMDDDDNYSTRERKFHLMETAVAFTLSVADGNDVNFVGTVIRPTDNQPLHIWEEILKQ